MKRISGGQLSRRANATLLSGHAGGPRAAAGDRSFASQATAVDAAVESQPAASPRTNRTGRTSPPRPRDDDSDSSLGRAAESEQFRPRPSQRRHCWSHEQAASSRGLAAQRQASTQRWKQPDRGLGRLGPDERSRLLAPLAAHERTGDQTQVGARSVLADDERADAPSALAWVVCSPQSGARPARQQHDRNGPPTNYLWRQRCAVHATARCRASQRARVLCGDPRRRGARRSMSTSASGESASAAAH